MFENQWNVCNKTRTGVCVRADLRMCLDMNLIGMKVAEKLSVLISTHVQRQDTDCPEKKVSRHPVQFQTRVLSDRLPFVSRILRGCAVHCVAVHHLQY
jgi:hypothetical protein